MKEIFISTVDMERIRSQMDKARGGRVNAPINLGPLQQELDRATVLPPAKMPDGVVTMHSIVVLEYPDSKKTIRVQLVYPEEANPSKQKISVFAPVATALLGYSKGDVVTWKVPGGETKFRIADVIYQTGEELKK